jgi:hypothetical protein
MVAPPAIVSETAHFKDNEARAVPVQQKSDFVMRLTVF